MVQRSLSADYRLNYRSILVSAEARTRIRARPCARSGGRSHTHATHALSGKRARGYTRALIFASRNILPDVRPRVGFRRSLYLSLSQTPFSISCTHTRARARARTRLSRSASLLHRSAIRRNFSVYKVPSSFAAPLPPASPPS